MRSFEIPAWCRTKFSPGIGYHQASGVTKALESVTCMARADPKFRQFVYPSKEYGKSDRNKTYREHDLLESSTNILDMEHGLISLRLAVDPESTKGLVGSTTLHPFQKFMCLETLVVMMDRSGLGEHKPFLLGEIRRELGCLTWWTVSKIERICDLLSRRVVAHCIRRRMGKTVSMYAELAKCLTFFPRANLKSIYTVHKASLANQCHSNVKMAVMDMVKLFNRTQLAAYQARRREKHHVDTHLDFYYVARDFYKEYPDGTVEVTFIKRQVNDVDDRKVLVNALRAKAYRKNVSF